MKNWKKVDRTGISNRCLKFNNSKQIFSNLFLRLTLLISCSANYQPSKTRSLERKIYPFRKKYRRWKLIFKAKAVGMNKTIDIYFLRVSKCQDENESLKLFIEVFEKLTDFLAFFRRDTSNLGVLPKFGGLLQLLFILPLAWVALGDFICQSRSI